MSPGLLNFSCLRKFISNLWHLSKMFLIWFFSLKLFCHFNKNFKHFDLQNLTGPCTFETKKSWNNSNGVSASVQHETFPFWCLHLLLLKSMNVYVNVQTFSADCDIAFKFCCCWCFIYFYFSGPQEKTIVEVHVLLYNIIKTELFCILIFNVQVFYDRDMFVYSIKNTVYIL